MSDAKVEAIEAVFAEQALDFSSIPDLESTALPDEEWDTHRVYFNEFSTQHALHPEGRDESFQPFEVDTIASDADVLEPLTESELNKSRDDTLDPLGWPRQVAVFEDEQKGDDLVNDCDGDDENLLRTRRRRSDEDEQVNEKLSRLAQYAVVEPDEESLAAKSSDDEDSDADDVLEEVGYQSQEDEEESDSEICDQFKGFQFNSVDELGTALDSSTGMLQAFPIFEAHQHGGTNVEASVKRAAYTAVPAQSSGAPTPAFEVTWETKCSEFQGAPMTPGQTASSDTGTPTRKLRLLKPPPKETHQKWLDEKGL